MAHWVDFEGTNVTLTAPEGRDDIDTLKAFTNGRECVTAWHLSDVEMAEVLRTGTIWLNLLSGHTMPPAYVGTELSVRELCGIGCDGAFAPVDPPPKDIISSHNVMLKRFLMTCIGWAEANGGSFADVMTLLESLLLSGIVALINDDQQKAALDATYENLNRRLKDSQEKRALKQAVPQGNA